MLFILSFLFTEQAQPYFAVDVVYFDRQVNILTISHTYNMSSGGGISRFAVRKQVSSNEDKSASTPNDNIQIAAATAPKFSFGLNENSDALSTTSDDEFGFLGGGGNSIGGDDFFMSDGGYNHERNAFEEANGDSTIAVEVSEQANPVYFIIFNKSSTLIHPMLYEIEYACSKWWHCFIPWSHSNCAISYCPCKYQLSWEYMRRKRSCSKRFFVECFDASAASIQLQ